MLPRGEFLASLPRKRVTASALIRDERGRVLLVEPTHRPDWLRPGGTVEADESPRCGASREVLEELGVRLPLGRALVMQWVRRDHDPDGALHLAYDGGVVDAATIARFVLPPAEIAAVHLVEPGDVPAHTSPATAARVTAALDAIESGRSVEI